MAEAVQEKAAGTIDHDREQLDENGGEQQGEHRQEAEKKWLTYLLRENSM